MSEIKLTRLTKMQVEAIERYLPEMETTPSTATYVGPVATLAEAARTALKEHGSTPGAKALHAVIRKLDTHIDPEQPEPAKRTRKAKADKAPKVVPEPTPVRDDVRAFLDGLASGEVSKRMAADNLTPGKLARGLGVTSVAPVAKYLGGKRTPRPQPEQGSTADLLARWWVGNLGLDTAAMAEAATPQPEVAS